MPGSIITSRLSVYPRWRGEHVNGFWRDADWLGLSPLARGTHRHVNINNCHLRFIPAGAGNTCVPQMRKPARTVYPRWRGEHPCMSHQQQYGLGLSPLARGTPIISRLVAAIPRFIPAGAGNTPPERGNSHYISVYPRWRGEHTGFVSAADAELGLSPLARGTLRHHLLSTRCRRFIPAGAGNTFRRVRRENNEPVYPRWRGEHRMCSQLSTPSSGLSPLARGTLRTARRLTALLRFIPAGAGNTNA